MTNEQFNNWLGRLDQGGDLEFRYNGEILDLETNQTIGHYDKTRIVIYAKGLTVKQTEALKDRIAKIATWWIQEAADKGWLDQYSPELKALAKIGAE